MHCLNSVTNFCWGGGFGSLTADFIQSPVTSRGKTISVLAGCKEQNNI